MEIFPAIDLKKGKCVRLTQGDFATATIYESDPLKQAQKFKDAGSTWLHMVDLDGAKIGEMQQFDIIAMIASQTTLKIQVGGGIRDEAVIDKLLHAGVERVVIGSLAVKNSLQVLGWLKKYGPDKIVLAFDVRLDVDGQPEILIHGWKSGSKQLLWDVLERYADSGLKTILCTDIGRDGMLAGTNNDLYKDIQTRFPNLDILASGGVSNLADLLELAELKLAGAITGKAIYEGRLDLAEAIKQVRNVG
jgi:phosphoribosylformimino-5-aminoimidazole carboxamide ribotide isomerase